MIHAVMAPARENGEVWVAPDDECFLKDKQHAGRASTDGHTSKMGKVT